MHRIIHKVDRAAGEVVRRLRTGKRLSQSALGERVGVSYQQIQKYETGINRMSVSKLFEIAEALGTSSRDMLVTIALEIDAATAKKRRARRG